LNGRTAKKLRKVFYGEQYPKDFRQYKRFDDGEIRADSIRQMYQKAKQKIIKGGVVG